MISFLAAWLLVSQFGLDLVTTVVGAATGGQTDSSVPGTVLTAMVLAGGSAGVNNVLVALGFREKKTPEAAIPKPPPDKAWIAVRINRKLAVRSIEVHIGTPSAANAPIPLVGMINGTSKRGLRYFLSDPGRFPTFGGHQVPAGVETRVDVIGQDKNKQNLPTVQWGPHVIAGGAIIDLEFDL
jgi:hypothetical protein